MDIDYYNRKYNSLKSLSTSKGDLNSAILRRSWFKQLDIYDYIIENTRCLDKFDVKFNDRFSFLVDGIKIEKCRTCGKEYVVFPKSQRRYSGCTHKQKIFEGKSDQMVGMFKRKKNRLINMLDDTSLIVDVKRVMEYVEAVFDCDNYCFPITDKDIGILHDMIIMTDGLVPFDIDDMKFGERTYIIHNHLDRLPVCEYCGGKVSFRGRRYGYSRCCDRCYNKLAHETRNRRIKDTIASFVDKTKYDIVSLPRTLNDGVLVIRCKKCGKVSNWRINNGRINILKEGMLCHYCELVHSRCEELLYNAISERYDGEIVHGSGSRKIIPPYELDVYLPEKKFAIEYDGLHWHSEENGRGMNYHLNKTEMCEKNGITLVHVFENVYLEGKEKVMSNIMDRLGIYDESINDYYILDDVEPYKITEFKNDNSLVRSNTMMNVCAVNSGEIVALMSFSKMRYNGKYQFQLMEYTQKINCRVIDGFPSLLGFFERKYSPESVCSYVDRRINDSRYYVDCGFCLDHNTRPNYHWIKNGCVIGGKMTVNEKYVRRLPEYDENMNIIDNMKKNGYERIWDCGNSVYVKRYNMRKDV